VSAVVRAEPATKTISPEISLHLTEAEVEEFNESNPVVSLNTSQVPLKPGEGITLNRQNYQIVVYLGPNDLRGLSSTAGQGDGHFEFRINFVPR
jgi:hypothetical protein